MIENSNNVNSYHTHEHTVTQCLHASQGEVPKKGGAAGAGNAANTEAAAKRQAPTAFSLYGWMANGLKGLASRAAAYWAEAGRVPDDKLPADSKMVHSSGVNAEYISSDVLATAVVKHETERKDEVVSDEKTDKKIGSIDGAVSSGLKKGQGNIKKFFQKLEDMAAQTGKAWKKKKEAKLSLTANNTNVETQDSSFLLDSYNKTGEYSTLAKDRSLEGKFRANV